MNSEEFQSDRYPTDGCSAQQGEAWRAACAQGMDMSLVELSLQKTPWERLLEHDDALQFAAKLRLAGKQLDGKA
jgi:hypothetical protein